MEQVTVKTESNGETGGILYIMKNTEEPQKRSIYSSKNKQCDSAFALLL